MRVNLPNGIQWIADMCMPIRGSDNC